MLDTEGYLVKCILCGWPPAHPRLPGAGAPGGICERGQTLAVRPMDPPMGSVVITRIHEGCEVHIA